MSQRRDIHPFAAIALAALPIRVRVIILFDRNPVSDEVDDLTKAQSILSGRGCSFAGVPMAYQPPGFPTILAGLHWLRDGSLLFFRGLQGVIDTASCLRVDDIGKRVSTESDAVIVACRLSLVALFISSAQTLPAIMSSAVLVQVSAVILLMCFGEARYRFPLHPVLILLAVHGWTLLQSRRYSFSRLRVAVGTVIGLLLLAGWSAELWMLET